MGKRAFLILTAATCAALATLCPGCSCSVTGGEGAKQIDVSMGGHMMSDNRLNFKAVGYSNQQLTIRNTATETPLLIGPGTPITKGDGTVVATVVGHDISIPPNGLGILALSAPLAVSETYYLGATDAGKPSIRQLFMCPGDAAPSGGGAVPNVPQAEPSLPSE